jgi:hypothetical protein
VNNHQPIDRVRKYLIPQPQEIEGKEGSFAWPDVLLLEPWGDLDERENDRLAEFADTLHRELGIRLEVASPDEEPHLNLFLHPLVPPGFTENDFPASGETFIRDSYVLQVGEEITLWAGGGPGLFYGLETLLQVFRSGAGERSTPGLLIRDVPAFDHRMVQYDIAREQTVKMEHLKRVIRRLASLKVNEVMLYLEYRYRWESHPEFGPPGTLTADQADELVQFARSYYIDLVPQVNVLGHVEGFLRHENWAHLRELPDNPFQLCPDKPESYELFRELIAEMLPHFPVDYFHVGGDESWELGKCPQCAAKAEKEGIAAVYADHMVKFHEFLRSRGKRMAVWGDIMLQHKEIADRMPKDIIVFDWHYHASSAESLDFFREKGFEVYAASSLTAYESNRFVPRWDRSDANTGPFFRDAAERNLRGACYTTWEMFHGNFFQNNWYHIIYGAQASWNPAESSDGGLSERFGEAFMGDPGNHLTGILRILGERMRSIWNGFEGESDAGPIRRVFFDPDPLKLPRDAANGITAEQIAESYDALDEAAELLHVGRQQATRNTDLFEWLDFPIRMYRSALRRIQCFTIAKGSYDGAVDAKQKTSQDALLPVVEVLDAFLNIQNDLEYYLTEQPFAIERYGSSKDDLDRYRAQVTNLTEYIGRILEALRGWPEGPMPDPKDLGLG